MHHPANAKPEFSFLLEGDEKLSYLGIPQQSSRSAEAKELLQKYYDEYVENLGVEGYTVPGSFVTNAIQFEDADKEFSGRGLMWDLADFPTSASISPIFPPQGWGFEVPADSKEFVMLTGMGKVVRFGLILKNADGFCFR